MSLSGIQIPAPETSTHIQSQFVKVEKVQVQLIKLISKQLQQKQQNHDILNPFHLPRHKIAIFQHPSYPSNLSSFSQTSFPTLAQRLQSLRQLTLPRLGDAQGVPGIAAVGHAPCQVERFDICDMKWL